jgi:glycosyltransferase involved in cell wall biosynthesis
MKATIVVNGRFHLFHLARQLEKRGLLERIYSSYPRFKLQDEPGIPSEKIETFPFLHAPYMAALRVGLAAAPRRVRRTWTRWSHEAIDRYVCARLSSPTVLIALSGGGLKSGTKAQGLGGAYICDRGSSHIRYQDRILHEEYRRWGLEFEGIDPTMIRREECEYKQADAITLPSDFCVVSFVGEGVAREKIHLAPYGARLERFKPRCEPPKDEFRVIWVGSISFRKAFLDALHAFQQLKVANKRFIVAGMVEPALRNLLSNEQLGGVEFVGQIPNNDLPSFISSAHAFVLPSVEEGLAMVMGEAMACGCPVIASDHTGARNLFTDGVEGFILPIRSPDSICARMSLLAGNETLRKQMSSAALQRVQHLGGWDAYGERMAKVIESLAGQTPRQSTAGSALV